MKVTFTCSKDILAIGIFPRSRQAEIKALFALADKKGGYVTVTLELPRKPRTTGEGSQGHHLNGHIQQIAESTGTPFDVVKMEVKHQAITRGYPILYAPDGKARHDIYGREMGISEADSSTAECALLIETVHQLASELDIALVEK